MILDLMILGLCVLWGVTGFAVCRVTHQQRGLETDHVGVPDYVPTGWTSVTEPVNHS